MKIGYYIYKYVYNDEIIYIGKTDSDLKGRIKCHSKEYQFQKYLSDAKIFYYECKNPAHTAILEIYYINKYKPILNKAMKYDDDLDIYIKDVDWIPIDESTTTTFRQISKPTERLKIIEERIKAITYFYRLYRKNQRRKYYNFYDLTCVIQNITPEDAMKIISKYKVPLYYQNTDGSMSYHPTIHHCKYNEEKQELFFWINKNLYRDNFSKNPKEILRANRDRLLKEKDGIIKQLQRKKEVGSNV